jgi:site-specific DNA-methyltransferase (adenine-specific)
MELTWPDDYVDNVICGDCMDVMRQMPDESVDLVVTSPPYDNLRDYHGYTLDVPGMIDQFMRIMKPGGVIVWVVGDATINGSETGTSFRQALAFMDAGFRLHDTMIYRKRNFVPLTHNRYEQCFEYMFVLSKGRPNTFNPITLPCLSAGKTNNHASEKHYEDSHAMRKRDHTVPVRDTKLHHNIFEYTIGMNDRTEHNAPFPEKLAADHIISWSNEGDLVFDPMCGSGTTCKMAERLDRHWIGIDCSEQYCDIARERIRIERSQLTLDLTRR